MAGLVRFAGGSDEGLSGAQETALMALREGQTFVAAAQRAGVGRATVYRWVQSDPHFQAAYNLWQRELAESARARLLKLTDKAVEVIEKALKRDDEQVAMQMLRHTGVLRRRGERSTERLGDESKPQDETTDETCAPEAAVPPAEAPVASEADPMPNPLPQQEMESETPPPSLKLAGETEAEAPKAVSRETEADPNSQMIEGWRVGTKLYAVP